MSGPGGGGMPGKGTEIPSGTPPVGPGDLWLQGGAPSVSRGVVG